MRPNIQGFQSKADLLWVSRGLRRGRKTYPMDNRFRFLYFMISELWGHRDKGRAGNGKTGASEVASWEGKPPCIRRMREA